MLALYLPTSTYYTTLSSLPPPDPTTPTATTTYNAQAAIHNSLPILQEIVALTEAEEESVLKNEVEKRVTRSFSEGLTRMKIANAFEGSARCEN